MSAWPTEEEVTAMLLLTLVYAWIVMMGIGGLASAWDFRTLGYVESLVPGFLTLHLLHGRRS